MAQTIKEGDTVRLKAGGPDMTVDELTDDGAWCNWFAGKKREREHFRLVSLVRTEDVPKKADGDDQ